MYRVLTTFRDLEDGHLYQTGDPFPHDGREVRPERVESLINGRNQANLRLIEAVYINTPEEPQAAQKHSRVRNTNNE